MYRALLCCYFLAMVFPLCGQQTGRLPIQFSQFTTTFPLINPAADGFRNDINFTAVNQMHSGPFNEIRTFLAHGGINLNGKEKRTDKNILGITFYNDKEGALINRNRVYLNYGYHQKLAPELWLAGGAAAGFVNYYFEGTDVSAGGSAFAWDASLGVWLYNKEFFAGFSINQPLRNTLRPVKEAFLLLPHFHLTGGKRFRLSRNVRLSTSALIRWAGEQRMNVEFTGRCLFNKLLMAGTGYGYRRGVLLLAGLNKIPSVSDNLAFTFSFRKPVFPGDNLNMETFEVGVRYGVSEN